MVSKEKILDDVLQLNTTEKLQLVDEILTSLNPVNKGVQALWEEEAEERIIAYKEGRISSEDEKDVLKKYRK